jgi:hypothetical protein
MPLRRLERQARHNAHPMKSYQDIQCTIQYMKRRSVISFSPRPARHHACYNRYVAFAAAQLWTTSRTPSPSQALDILSKGQATQ